MPESLRAILELEDALDDPHRPLRIPPVTSFEESGRVPCRLANEMIGRLWHRRTYEPDLGIPVSVRPRERYRAELVPIYRGFDELRGLQIVGAIARPRTMNEPSS